MREKSDEYLVRKAQNGDAGAFEELVNRFYSRIFRLCLGVLGNRQDAEDCTQEAFLKVFRSFGTYNGKASFYTWLYRIAMNACYDHLRKVKKVSEVSMDSARNDSEMPLSSQLADLSPEPDELAERNWTTEVVRAGILQLPEISARVVWMRDIEDLSYSQIAGIEGVPEGTVKSRLFRGREQLGRILADQELL